jgi:hypothetical protein
MVSYHSFVYMSSLMYIGSNNSKHCTFFIYYTTKREYYVTGDTEPPRELNMLSTYSILSLHVP